MASKSLTPNTASRIEGIIYLKTPIIAFADNRHVQYFQVHSNYWVTGTDLRGWNAMREGQTYPHFSMDPENVVAFQRGPLMEDMIEGTFQADI